MRHDAKAALAAAVLAVPLIVTEAGATVTVPRRNSGPTPDCQGTCYYVNVTTGSDSNSGLSTGAAFRTINRGVQAMTAGSTVLVMNGTYQGGDGSGGQITLNKTGTSSAWIKLVAYPGHAPVIRPNTSSWNSIAIHNGAAYVLVDGIEIHGLRTTITDTAAAEADNGQNPLYNHNCILVDGRGSGMVPHHIVIRENNLHDCAGAGVAVVAADYVTVSYNFLKQNGFWSAYGQSGISLYELEDIDTETGYKSWVVGNRAVANENKVRCICSGDTAITDGNGIIIDDLRHTQNPGTAYGGRVYVANNYSLKNGGRGIHVFSSDHVDVVNNSTYKNLLTSNISSSEVGAFQASDVKIVNNMAQNLNGKAVTGPVQTDQHHNVLGGSNVPITGPSDILANPQYTDPAGGNLTPKATSPGLTNGDAALAPDIDIWGTSRPAGSVDRGAVQVSQ